MIAAPALRAPPRQLMPQSLPACQSGIIPPLGGNFHRCVPLAEMRLDVSMSFVYGRRAYRYSRGANDYLNEAHPIAAEAPRSVIWNPRSSTSPSLR